MKKLGNYCVIGLLYLYKATLSPSSGVARFIPGYPKNTCVFYPTCSSYAIAVFKKESFFSALKKTIHRISRCHPGTPPSVDLP